MEDTVQATRDRSSGLPHGVISAAVAVLVDQQSM